MRLTKLFLTYFTNLFGSALIYAELINVNQVKFQFSLFLKKLKEIKLTNRIVGAILLGLLLSYLFHYMVEWLYRAIFLQFCSTQHRNNLVYHLFCWGFMVLFGILTMIEMGKVKYEQFFIFSLYFTKSL